MLCRATVGVSSDSDGTLRCRCQGLTERLDPSVPRLLRTLTSVDTDMASSHGPSMVRRRSTIAFSGVDACRCSSSLFNGTGLSSDTFPVYHLRMWSRPLPLRLCRTVTFSDPFQLALRRWSVRLVGCQGRHPSLRSLLATVPCCLERRCSFAAMAFRYARRCARLRSRVTVYGFRDQQD